jgi:hypothetical protein
LVPPCPPPVAVSMVKLLPVVVTVGVYADATPLLNSAANDAAIKDFFIIPLLNFSYQTTH